MFFSFFGGFIAGAFGQGGGSIFNPVLIEMGVSPVVSGATGMYMVMFSALSSTTMFAMSNQLDFTYSIWLSFWSVLGICYGLRRVDNYIKLTKRESVLVYLMSFVLAISALLIPIFSVLEALQEMDRGKDIFKFKNLCK